MNKCKNIGLCELLRKRDLRCKNKGEGGDARNVTA